MVPPRPVKFVISRRELLSCHEMPPSCPTTPRFGPFESFSFYVISDSHHSLNVHAYIHFLKRIYLAEKQQKGKFPRLTRNMQALQAIRGNVVGSALGISHPGFFQDWDVWIFALPSGYPDHLSPLLRALKGQETALGWVTWPMFSFLNTIKLQIPSYPKASKVNTLIHGGRQLYPFFAPRVTVRKVTYITALEGII